MTSYMKFTKRFSRIWSTLSRQNKKKVVIATLLLFTSSIFDLLGVVSILPITLALADFSVLGENQIFLKINSYLNFNKNELIIFLSLFSFVVIVLNQCLRVLSKQYVTILSLNLMYENSRDLFFYYLNKPYDFFLSQNNANLLQKCTNYVKSGIGGHIQPILLIFGSLSSSILIAFFLLLNQPVITIMLTIALLLFYSIFYRQIKDKILESSKAIPNHFNNIARTVGDALGSIKEGKLSDNSVFFLNRYKKPAIKERDANAVLNLFRELPQAFVEIFALGLLLSIFVFLHFYTVNLTEMIPILALIGISLKRLIPAVQSIYTQILVIKFFQNTVDNIINDIESSSKFNNKFNFDSENKIKENNIKFDDKLIFKNIKFFYSKNGNSLQANKTIKKGQFIGICGKSGDGKTTFVDLMTGLLTPNQGKILIDEKRLEKRDFKSWVKKIGYVPQEGYLLNDTLLNNILFGQKKINRRNIKKICKLVNLSNFINRKLPKSYQTKLGQDGVKVSGGEKQRIMIARALYKNPEILILDESTSALDTINAEKIIQNIRKEYKKITLIFISHKIKSLKQCDNILFFDDGKITDNGKYNYLIKNNKNFKLLTKSEEKNLRI